MAKQTNDAAPNKELLRIERNRIRGVNVDFLGQCVSIGIGANQHELDLASAAWLHFNILLARSVRDGYLDNFVSINIDCLR